MSDYKLKINIGKKVTMFRDFYGNAPIRYACCDYFFDFDVGSNVEVNGVNFKVVKDKSIDDICKDCVFQFCGNYDGLPKKVQNYMCSKSLCARNFRRDFKNVHYKEVKE